VDLWTACRQALAAFAGKRMLLATGGAMLRIVGGTLNAYGGANLLITLKIPPRRWKEILSVFMG
jgi:hypothetical protein